MPAKKGRGKGKTMKITEFASDYIAEDVYDYVDDSWMTEEQAKKEKLAEKISMREYSRVANNTLNDQESFRTTDNTASAEELISQLEPPFVAHIGNLRNGVTEEQFLSLFNTSVVKTHRLIKQEGKTFAFIEFTTSDALAVALCMDKTFQNGRQMYVNLANKKQIDRLLDLDGGDSPSSPNQRFGSLSRDMFDSTPSGASSPIIGREAFGASSPPQREVELTRDIIGSAIESPTSALSFDNWRNEASVTDNDGEGSNAPGSTVRAKPRDNWRSADVASPVTKDNWRSDKAPASPKERGGPASPKDNSEGFPKRGGGAAAAEGSWRRDAGSPTSDNNKNNKGGSSNNSNKQQQQQQKSIKRTDSAPSDDKWGKLRK